MSKKTPSGIPLAYFYDFVEKLKEEYPPASLFAVLEEIAFAREVGPALAGLRKNTAGAYEMVIPIGYGKHALVELEFDRYDVLQPVLGGILKE